MTWQNLNQINGVIQKYNEHAYFVDPTLQLDYAQVGDNVADSIRALQSAVTNPAFFSHAIPPSAPFAGLAIGEPYPSPYGPDGLAQVFAEAGLPNGFRRWPQHPNNNVQYGPLESGDYIRGYDGYISDIIAMVDAVSVFSSTSLYAYRFPNLDMQGTLFDTYHINEHIYDDSWTDYNNPPIDLVDDFLATLTPASYPARALADYTLPDAGYTQLSASDTLSRVTAEGGIPDKLLNWWPDPGVWVTTRYYEWTVRNNVWHLSAQHPFKPNRRVGGKLYARVVADGTDNFWADPYGPESTVTKLISSRRPYGTIGGPGYTNWSDIFPPRPHYNDHPQTPSGFPKSAKLQDLVQRIELS